MDPQQVVRQSDGTMQCRECGFSYTLDREGVRRESMSDLDAVRAALDGVAEDMRATRPEPAIWSANAYTSHLADAAAVILSRVRVIATQDRPPLAWHDQDQAVEEQRADEIPAATSFARLAPTVEEFVAYLDMLPENAWERMGIHARAGEVRLGEIAQDMPHELRHHAMDIRRVGASRSTAARNTV